MRTITSGLLAGLVVNAIDIYLAFSASMIVGSLIGGVLAVRVYERDTSRR